MWQQFRHFERTQVGGRVSDKASLCIGAAGEACEALREAGFTPCAEVVGEADDEDGHNPGPLSRAHVREGGIVDNPIRCLHSELWSRDQDTGAEVGFVCVHDLMKGVFYAKLTQRSSSTIDEDAQRVTKGAITTLLDVSEASRSRKISLGLDPVLTGNTELICSLLYLGFQVVPPRKYPLADVALILDLDLGFQGGDFSHTSDNTFTGTSDCSTNDAEDYGAATCDSESE